MVRLLKGRQAWELKRGKSFRRKARRGHWLQEDQEDKEAVNMSGESVSLHCRLIVCSFLG